MSARPSADHPIRIQRAIRVWSLRTLARLSGVHHVRIFYIETGSRASAVEIERLAAALGCSPADLQPGGAS